MNAIASIQKVSNVRNHPKADALDLVDILGWTVVVKRGEFTNGSLCVYIVIDSIVEEHPEYEFLRKNHFRIKPIRLRGEYSNGICFPVSILLSFGYTGEITEGMDVSDIVKAKHYEKELPTQLAGKAIGYLPGFLRMTDEQNIRSCPEILTELKGLPYYMSVKADGSSGTFFIKGGDIGVCSRKIQLAEDENNGFWKIARKYDMFNAIRTDFIDDIAVQGEVVGPGIQDNHLGLKELEIRVFNIVDLKVREYRPLSILKDWARKYDIPMVTIIEEGDAFGYELHELISVANALIYPTGKPAEGMVIRPINYIRTNIDKMAWNALSGKIINENYKEKD